MMKATARYHVTALPTLGELGSKPPITLGELRERFVDQAWACEPVDAILLLDDLIQRESFLAGESEEIDPAVLTHDQVRNEAPLPDVLHEDARDTTETTTSLEVDRLWNTYFYYVVALSHRMQCPFLREWARFEVGLRNALAVARAEQLGLAGEDYRVAPDFEEADEDLSDIVGEWTRAENPLSGYRLLIRARWDWTHDHEQWFSFRVDELAAYAVKLMLLHQAYRLATLEEQVQHR